MDFAGSDEPPSKKRRFFADAADETSEDPTATTPRIGTSTSPTINGTRCHLKVDDDARLKPAEPAVPSPPLPAQSSLSHRQADASFHRVPTPPNQRPTPDDGPVPAAFDQGTFESFVGESLD